MTEIPIGEHRVGMVAGAHQIELRVDDPDGSTYLYLYLGRDEVTWMRDAMSRWLTTGEVERGA